MQPRGEHLLGSRHADRPDQSARRQALAERRAHAVAGVGEHAAEAHAGGDDPVDLGQRDLGFGPRRARRFRHTRTIAARRVVGPGCRQEQAQADRDRHFAARQSERDQRLAVRLLTKFATVLRRNTYRQRALLGDRGVVDHQHRILAAEQSVSPLGQRPPQRRIVPLRAADEVMQLVVPLQAKTGRDWLHALGPVRAQEATDVKRPPTPPRAATHEVEKRPQPGVKIVSRCRRSGHSACFAESQPDI